MKKILFVATVVEHFYYFHLPCFEMLKENGFEVHVAASGKTELEFCDKYFELPFERSPFKKENVKVYKELKKIINENNYDIIHCHTPVGGVLARLAARAARKTGTRVIYTAHGFHFCKGGSKSGWLIYYPIEKLLSGVTDCLITINDEDYGNAVKRLHAKDVKEIHGVGCDLKKFTPATPQEKHEIRQSLGYTDDERLLIFVAELNRNKNQKLLIDAAKEVQKKHPEIRLLLVGPDHFDGQYVSYAQSIEAPVSFLGVRSDVPLLLKASDLITASSFREGLPVNVMEAMATGLPAVASDNRGHRALVKNGENGFIVPVNRPDIMAQKIIELLENAELYKAFSARTLKMVQPYGKDNVLNELRGIYFDRDKNNRNKV